MQKILSSVCAALLLPVAGLLTAQMIEVSDSFDYGSGVDGRETVSFGSTIDDRDVLVGTGTWSSSGASADPTFGGASGPGNGLLDISSTGTNSRVDLAFDFTPGIVTATVEFSFTGLGTSGARGIFFGFDSANRDNNLMTNADTDTGWVRIRPNQVVSRRQVDGTSNNDINSDILFTPDGSGVMSGTATMEYNIFEDTLIATVTGGSEVYSRTWDMFGETPDFGAIAINTVHGEDVHIHNFEATAVPEPGAYAFLVGLLASAWMLWRRRCHR